MLSTLSALSINARGAAWRRQWYERPGARRRLSRPVVSVGALAAGGRGKTPVAPWSPSCCATRVSGWRF